ncbi:iron-containing alcohol dehydrogenase family protein [Brachyspira hampsonii]|uniref:iron-containing alcohol dehydrogenase family protein n=1 Tax=Brachyspira hampsonii TaxID=1287055 RepID=UPI000D3AE932|nr:iron-containing alcohol dehydrogenase family protein [Brachyspira hampsonii]PTY40280.1 glycerol dehydrogenase [Brachyspira hampsonii bv. II]
MSIENLFLTNFSIGSDAYKDVYDICSNYGKKVVIISGKKSIQASIELILNNIKDISITGMLHYGGNSTFENVDLLKEKKAVIEADMIFAVGGGRALDTSKVLADMMNKPIFTFPTLASNSAAVTSLSVVYDNDGSFREMFSLKRPPLHTFINTDVILNSPENYFIAGLGNALSKQYEVLFYTRNESLNYRNFLGIEIIKNCSNDILKYYSEAVNDFRNKKSSDVLNRVILHIIYTAGLTSVMAGYNYNIYLHNGLTKLKRMGEKFLHGELVAYGILLLLTMNEQYDAREDIFKFNKSMSLPTCLKDIGINKASLENDDINTALDTKYISSYGLDKEMVLKAIIDLEEFNNSKYIK